MKVFVSKKIPNSFKRILSFDPGVTQMGFCSYDGENIELKTLSPTSTMKRSFPHLVFLLHKWFYETFSQEFIHLKPDIVVIEYPPFKGVPVPGLVMITSFIFDIFHKESDVIFLPPGFGKKHFPLLKSEYKIGSSVHERDAITQLAFVLSLYDVNWFETKPDFKSELVFLEEFMKSLQICSEPLKVNRKKRGS